MPLALVICAYMIGGSVALQSTYTVATGLIDRSHAKPVCCDPARDTAKATTK